MLVEFENNCGYIQIRESGSLDGWVIIESCGIFHIWKSYNARMNGVSPDFYAETLEESYFRVNLL